MGDSSYFQNSAKQRQIRYSMQSTVICILAWEAEVGWTRRRGSLPMVQKFWDMESGLYSAILFRPWVLSVPNVTP